MDFFILASAMVCMWMSKDNFQEYISPATISRDQIHDISLGAKHLYQLNHLAHLFFTSLLMKSTKVKYLIYSNFIRFDDSYDPVYGYRWGKSRLSRGMHAKK